MKHLCHPVFLQYHVSDESAEGFSSSFVFFSFDLELLHFVTQSLLGFNVVYRLPFSVLYKIQFRKSTALHTYIASLVSQFTIVYYSIVPSQYNSNSKNGAHFFLILHEV